VIKLDPRAANLATVSVATAPADGFLTPAQYRGAFNAGDNLHVADREAARARGSTNLLVLVIDHAMSLECEPGTQAIAMPVDVAARSKKLR
jgi:hypothetical protein